MKTRLGKKTTRASTMVEVVVALGILVIVGAGILGSFKYGFFAMSMARENQRATQIMLAKVETIRLYRWDQVVYSNNFIPASFTEVYDPQGSSGQQGAIYTGFVSISNCPSPISAKSYATNMRACTVTLNWKTGRIPRSRTITTYIARDGIQNYVY